jgi:hypothetical protein
MTPKQEKRKNALMAGLTDADLVRQLRHFDAITAGGKSEEHERLMRSWLITEVERRFPAADAGMDEAIAAADAADELNGTYTHIDYVGTLIGFLPAELQAA